MIKMNVDTLFDIMKQAMGESVTPSPPLENNNSCAWCNSENMFLNADTDRVCGDCGMVDPSCGRIDDGAEWSSCVTDEGAKDGSRVGMAANPLYNEWGMGTKIGQSKGMKWEHRRMAKIDFHISSNHKDRSLHMSYTDIQEACVPIGISNSVIELAKCFYKKVSEKGITRGAVRTGMKANCVYYACKREGYPRTLHEIAQAFGITTKDISRVQKKFRDFLGEDDTEERVIMGSDMVPRLLSEITNGSMSGKEVQHIVHLCRRVERNQEFMGKAGKGIATACIYFMMKDNIKLDLLCEKTGVSKISINKFINTIEKMEIMNIWTDGSCLNNPGPGGWAFVTSDGNQMTGGTKETTNNRMELNAAIQALKWANEHHPKQKIIIHTDSKYVKDGITRWIAKWKLKNYKDVKNDDLWKILEKENDERIDWRWVKAHAGTPENEKVDNLARQEAIKQKDT